MSLPQSISPNETLGRGVFSSKQVRQAKNGTMPRRVFLEGWGKVTLSVDRLDFAEPEEMAALGDKVAVGRSVNRTVTFYGWAVIDAEDAGSSERRVVYTPRPDNPYHTDIILPDSAAEDRDEQISHAQELADASLWRERPNSTKTDE